MSEAHRYMNFLSDAAESEPDDGDALPFTDNVIVMPTPHEDSWHGLFAFDAHGGHEEIYADLDQVIAWARDRSARIQIWNEALQDLEPLPVSS